MSHRIVVTGTTGQVGGAFCQLGLPGADIIAVDRSTLPLDNLAVIKSTLTGLAPDIVLNCAAYTAVDKAEDNPRLAHIINAEAPAEIAEFCAARKIPLVHVSTDYVFDGRKQSPYLPDDEMTPLGVYGKSKAAGEQALREICTRHVILRTAWVYSAGGKNFLQTMLRLGQKQNELSVVDDQFGCPTSAKDVAGALGRILAALLAGATPWGTYHFCNRDETTWHGFASEIFSQLSELGRTVPKVLPISTKEYPTPAVRPERSVLNCESFIDTFGLEPRNWQLALRDEILEIFSE